MGILLSEIHPLPEKEDREKGPELREQTLRYKGGGQAVARQQHEDSWTLKELETDRNIHGSATSSTLTLQGHLKLCHYSPFLSTNLFHVCGSSAYNVCA